MTVDGLSELHRDTFLCVTLRGKFPVYGACYASGPILQIPSTENGCATGSPDMRKARL
jgi:hypothetical protein